MALVSNPTPVPQAIADAAAAVFPVTAPTGVAGTDTANIAAALAAAKVSGGRVQLRYAPAPGYVINAALQVPSGVVLEGQGEGNTVLTPAAGFAGPVLEVQKWGATSPAGTDWEFTLQGWLSGVRRLSVWGATIPNPAAINAGAIADNRQVSDGIFIHDTDRAVLEDISINWLAGYGIKIGAGPVRETHFSNIKIWRCGNSATSKGCLHFSNSVGPADQNNTLHFDDLRIVYPHWIAIYADQSGDTAALGTRLLHFVGGQIEAGGYGGAPGTMQTTGTPFPYDLVYLGNCKDVYFADLELATSGQKIINLAGNGVHNVQSTIITNCDLIDANGAGGIYADHIDNLIVDHCFGYTPGGKMITITANARRVLYGDRNNIQDTVANAPLNASNFDASANPAAFLGPTDNPARAVGAAGQPAFAANFANVGGVWAPLKFWKDATGTIHTLGYVTTTGNIAQGDPIYTLPAGYRPASGQMLSDSAQTYVDNAGVVRSNVGAHAAGFSFWVAHHFPAGG